MKTEAYSPGLEGVVAGTTGLSHVNPDRNSLMYCGYDIRDLVEHSTFEEVAYLLLHKQLPTQAELDAFVATLKTERTLPQGVVDVLKLLPKEAIPMDLLRTGVSVLGLYETEVDNNSHEANLRKAIRLVAKFPLLIAYSFRLSKGQAIVEPDSKLNHAENFLYMLLGKQPDPYLAKVFDASLIAYADHGYNASTFAARVTTSTLADLHSGIVSAIGALKGPLHGGANEEAMRMLQEIGSVANAEAWIRDALATKKKIMGFGHREYKTGDPRAMILTAMGRELGERMGETKWAEMARIVTDVMVNEKSIHPNVDLPTSYIYYMMGLPIEIYTPIFALARVSGWSAHIIEQHDGNRLIRPKAIYEGPAHLDYLPIDRR